MHIIRYYDDAYFRVLSHLFNVSTTGYSNCSQVVIKYNF